MYNLDKLYCTSIDKHNSTSLTSPMDKVNSMYNVACACPCVVSISNCLVKLVRCLDNKEN